MSKKSKSGERDDQVMMAYRSLLKGGDGEIVKKDLVYYANRQSHVKDSPTETAFRDGQRVMARNILMLSGEIEDGNDEKTEPSGKLL